MASDWQDTPQSGVVAPEEEIGMVSLRPLGSMLLVFASQSSLIAICRWNPDSASSASGHPFDQEFNDFLEH